MRALEVNVYLQTAMFVMRSRTTLNYYLCNAATSFMGMVTDPIEVIPCNASNTEPWKEWLGPASDRIRGVLFHS